MSHYLIITNNPKVSEGYSDKYTLMDLSDGNYISVLEKARDLIHQGAKLLSHPLAGSLKPNQTPYRSVLLESFFPGDAEAGLRPQVDLKSLHIIESSLEAAHTFLADRITTAWPDHICRDFQTVDYSLFTSAIKRI